MTMKTINVAIYLRMSSVAQELSLDQQRDECRLLAAREGYTIIAEYVDAGKSGSKDTNKRPEFLRMIADASKGGFVAVLVWDTSRFGRLNSIEVGQYVSLLSKAGVFLHSVKEGKFDWRSHEGRMMWAMFCEANNRYSTSISENTIRGRRDIASRGLWASGKVPFGYDRQYVDLSGKPQQLVKRSDRFAKPRGWHLTLAVNEAEADVVRSIFARFAGEEISLRQLAAQLNKAGSLSGGEVWTARLLKLSLTNPAYIGRSYFGERSHKSMTVHNRAGSHGRDGVCPPLVDAKTYDRVQSVLNRRAESGSKPKTATAGLLSGFVICGHCGRKMEKKKSHGRVTYQCATGNKQPGVSCRMWAVKEDELGTFVVDYLERHVSAELLKLAEAKPEKRPESFADVLRIKVAELKRKVSNGRRNLLAADPEHAEELNLILRQWAEELSQAEADLALHAGEQSVNWLTWWEQHKTELLALWKPTGKPVSVCLNYGDGWEGDTPPVLTNPDKLKGLLREIGLVVRLWFREQEKPLECVRGRWARYVVRRREITVKVDTGAGEGIRVDVETSSTPVADILSILLRA